MPRHSKEEEERLAAERIQMRETAEKMELTELATYFTEVAPKPGQLYREMQQFGRLRTALVFELRERGYSVSQLAKMSGERQGTINQVITSELRKRRRNDYKW